MLLSLASEHHDVNGVGANRNIFCENQLCIIQDTDKSKVIIF